MLRAGPGRGIKAIVVYPMNALCNSQEEALKRFLRWGHPGGQGPVRFAKYTGQEDERARREIIANPPDILLTNYVMLELILTRADERQLVEQAQGVEFLVLDELHTYRGRQGADVAMLVRRVRQRCGAPTMRCVGTSATIAGSGAWEERRREVAAVATRLFGDHVPAENVIGERLRRGTVGEPPTVEALRAAVAGEPAYPEPQPGESEEQAAARYAHLAAHPLAVWAEGAFGLQRDARGELERRPPRTVAEVAQDLSGLTGVGAAHCAAHLRALLLAGSRAESPDTGFPLFAFRLHQFISRGDRVYTTPEPPGQRWVTTEGQRYVPGDRSRRVFPVAFCRACGQDYLVIALRQEQEAEARDLDERSEEEDVRMGYLVLDRPGLVDPADLTALPEDWTEARGGELRVRPAARAYAPHPVRVDAAGTLATDVQGGHAAWFMRAPFRFCLGCGTTYASAREKEFGRLAELASEGRSTATTVLSLAIVSALRAQPGLDPRAHKLLSFTDNRQDASLQAGHFNDFVQVTLLRAAILAAVRAAGPQGLGHDEIARRVVEHLALERREYASNPGAQFDAARRATDDALREVIGYRVYHDLRRGWRVTSPNLEQVGLLRVEYQDLDEMCQAEELWRGLGPDLARATPAQRLAVCRAVLDYLRRGLAIKATYLDPVHQDSLKQKSFSYLRPPWGFDEEERPVPATALATEGAKHRGRDDLSFGWRSLVGRYLRQGSTWPATRGQGQRITPTEHEALANGLIKALVTGGYLEEVADNRGAYRLQAGTVRWMAGDGTPQHDPIRVPNAPTGDTHVNAFFAHLYQQAAAALHGLEAREHTAQVPSDEREQRERRFETAELPILYCSPTMELGVDIRHLSAVNLRNVPPSPANYAQRSGRAGRSGEPALVLTYCTALSPHDQFYFRRRQAMVAGAVAPPRLDLANEDLVRAHVHAVWLAETGQSLYRSVADLLELANPDLPLRDEVRAYVDAPAYQLAAAARCHPILQGMAPELVGAAWFKPAWLDRALQGAPLAFNAAIDRWRHLYRAARQQQEVQHGIVSDPLRTQEERDRARALREEAEAQLDLLTRSRQDVFSDFYSYRYFATEGFLPGYNFPRLPVTAFIPGRRQKGDEDFLSRARFIAIAEFGPRAIIYHEGSRYRVARVVLPREESGGHTRAARFCRRCGYGHFGEALDASLCHACGVAFDGATSHTFYNLLRLESVSTRRVDRITCDEEERLRLGFEVRTIYRFAPGEDNQPAVTRAAFRAGDEVVAMATYGPAATIWRVNLGWNRRKDKNTVFGFMLDMEWGTWSRSEQEPDAREDEPDPLAPKAPTKRVVPFVEDRRNALVLQVAGVDDAPTLLSLQYALKRGIEAAYQLEESELAAEPLPDEREACQILLWEASEGGAGVLAQLAESPSALAEVARRACEVCHFPTEGPIPPGEHAGCEAACYDCLLSYRNQRHHALLDRKLLPAILERLSEVVGAAGAGGQPREEHLAQLRRLCQSNLEREFLDWLTARNLRLPDRAQAAPAPGLAARPDFLYDHLACVYVDGAPHHFPARQERDRAATEALQDLGYLVVRVQGPETWEAAVQRYPWVFGEAR